MTRARQTTHGASAHSAQTVAMLSGATNAQVRSDVPKHGVLGHRAPNGVFSITVNAWPPSKANQYRIISLGGHASLASSPQVKDFQVALAHAILDAYTQIGYHVDWYLTPNQIRSTRTRLPQPKPVNPLYGADVEVDVEVHLYEPRRTVRDTDGVDKVVFDVCTKMGVWRDDHQIGNRATIRPDHVGSRDAEMVQIILTARPVASWQRNASGRPTTTRLTASADVTGAASPRRKQQPRDRTTDARPRAPIARTTIAHATIARAKTPPIPIDELAVALAHATDSQGVAPHAPLAGSPTPARRSRRRVADR